MNISRFFGSTSREAMRQVRLALGPDALIVSNRRVNGGVEILASDATDLPAHDQPSAGASEPALAAAAQPALTVRSAPAAPAPRARAPSAAYQGASEEGVLHAIGALRGALEGRLDELVWSHQVRQTPVALQLFQTLLGTGFSTHLLRALLKRLPETLGERAALQWVRQELETRLPIVRSEDQLWQPGLALALVGPTGVGKTTTLAKMAARAVRRFGADNVVLITTDTYRIGAHEQLKIYGDLLRVPVHVVQDAQRLRTVLMGLRPDQVVLIDNVGISQRDRYVLEQANLLASAGRRIQRLLVLNAGSQGDTLDEVARSYSKDGGTPLSGCIISKLDEAIRLGATLDTAIRFKLPVHYVSIGQKVPEDLVFMSAAELVDATLKGRQHHAPLFTPSQSDLAAMLNHDSRIDVEHLRREHERRVQVLPRLLAAASGSAMTLKPEQTTQALAAIDDDLLMSQAYDMWRDAQTGQQAQTQPSEQIAALSQAVRYELSEQQQDYALVVHGAGAGTKAQGSAPLYSSIHSPAGQALAIPYFQIMTSEAWANSQGVYTLNKPSAQDALSLAQRDIEHLNPGLPLLHFVQGLGPQQWVAWAQRELDWVCAISPSTPLWHQHGQSRPSAIAKQLAFEAVTDLPSCLGLCRIQGSNVTELSLWYAHDQVQVRVRGQQPVTLQLLLLRVVRRHDGQVVKQYSALWHQTGRLGVSVQDVVCSLLLQAELKELPRLQAALEKQMLAYCLPEQTEQANLLLAQLSLAAWALYQSPDLQRIRQLVGSLMGSKTVRKQDAVAGLLKLFVLKDALA